MIRSISAKRARRNRAFRKVKALLWLRCRGRCEVPGCFRWAVDPHHILKGGGDGLGNLLACCREHHNWIELHPEESRRLGLSIGRYKA